MGHVKKERYYKCNYFIEVWHNEGIQLWKKALD